MRATGGRRGFVEPTDVQGVMALLQVGRASAFALASNAINERNDVAKSLALSMAARGMSRRKIAARLARAGMEVPHNTVVGWVVGLSSAGLTDQGSVPSAAALEQIEDELLASMRSEVEPEVRH